MTDTSDGRSVIWVPLIAWGVSFFLPAVTNNGNDWFFSGENLGYHAAFMSLSALVLFVAMLTLHPREPSALLLTAYIGTLWVGNIWMTLSPVIASAIRRTRGYAFVVTLWVWFLLALAAGIAVTASTSRHEYRLRYGYWIWLFSLFSMALLMTTYYFQVRRARVAPRR